MTEQKTLKVYIAGKVSPKSVFKTSFWREEFCKELEKKTGIKIINLDPTSSKTMPFDSKMIFGRDSFLIKSADLIIVNLTDDISVGGSQEMLIAKYFKKPLLGIAQEGGKFVNSNYNNFGRTVNFVHPFIFVPCDAVVNDLDSAAKWVKKDFPKIKKVKGIECIKDALDYYMKNYFEKDKFIKKTKK